MTKKQEEYPPSTIDKIAATGSIVDDEPLEIGVMDLDEETRLKIGVKEITLRCSADSKVSIAQYETTGIYAGQDITYDLTAFTGSMPVDEIIRKVVIPLRNSTVRLGHVDTMGRTEEIRAIVEGIRDGKQYGEIADNVSRTNRSFRSLFKKVFEVGRKTTSEGSN